LICLARVSARTAVAIVHACIDLASVVSDPVAIGVAVLAPSGADTERARWHEVRTMVPRADVVASTAVQRVIVEIFTDDAGAERLAVSAKATISKCADVEEAVLSR